jgi:hypothetical protein
VPRKATRPPARKYHNVPVLESTWLRLRDYKVRSQTYDEVLNALMDSVPLETMTERALAEHRRRMATFQGVDWRDVKEEIERGGRKPPTVSRRTGPTRAT